MEKFGKSKKSLFGFLLAASLLTGNVYAAKITLDFEGVGDLAAVNDFYNFGVDSAGNTGTDYGISFSNAAFGIIDANVDPINFHGNFANQFSGTTALIFLDGGDATMNVEAGFDSGLSFSYSSSENATVKIYDGLDGTGNLLASLNLLTNHHNNNCDFSSDFYCHWDLIGVNFRGKAKSVVFEGPRTATFYDDITLGRPRPSDCKKHGRRSRYLSDDDNCLDKDVRGECKDYRWKRKIRRSKWYD